MSTVTLHDASTIEAEIHGEGPVLLLPVNPRPVEGPQADAMRAWGMDPALGRSLVEGLRDAFTVVAFDYEGHVLANPKPETLTPANITRDLLAVADAAGADRFAYYGYSWLALSGLQLALRTDRLSALVMGGFPPVGGPYKEMLRVTGATHAMALAGPSGKASQTSAAGDWSSVEVTMSPDQTGQFVTLYEELQTFDDLAAQARVTCPRLCFVGSADDIEYGERWGDVRVGIASAVVERRAEIEALGWDVTVLDGLDHTGAMQPPAVLPVLRPWLEAKISR
ncbi:alpha/beta fold hydrolase [Streptosporangium saharense]|uniref:alpha/beta fold hydrolase n=1 Tax=Streptosporangium saharense TaxID=1706840 RepID=UPI0036C25E26